MPIGDPPPPEFEPFVYDESMAEMPTVSMPVVEYYTPPTREDHSIPYKYDEREILDEIKKYVDSTYDAHYIGEDNIQAIDLIKAGGMLMHFAAASIIKYAFRFGKKEGRNRKDILKVIHYAMFMLHALNKEKN